jgi:transcriptional regulator with XRE-family HTH domain
MFAMKVRERAEARRLRADLGLPLGEIARRLRVAKSSVSRWVEDVELTPEQIANLRDANPIFNAQQRGQGGRSREARRVRRAAQADGRLQARGGDGLHYAGCMLFWAEGSKARNSVVFVNSDVDMMRFFVRFLRECYNVSDAALCLSVNCFLNNGLIVGEIHDYWLKHLALDSSSLRQPTINVASSASKGVRNRLPYGTARIAVHSTFIVQSIYGAIQEYGGFNRPDWLDCRS